MPRIEQGVAGTLDAVVEDLSDYAADLDASPLPTVTVQTLIAGVVQPGFPDTNIIRDDIGLYHYVWLVPDAQPAATYDVHWQGNVAGVAWDGWDTVQIVVAGSLPQPVWSDITAAIAAKLKLDFPLLMAATNEIGDSAPGSLPAAVVWPPSPRALEEGPSIDTWTGTVLVEIPVSVEGGLSQAVKQASTILDGFGDSWHTGRLLGMPTLIVNSRFVTGRLTEISTWEPHLPGVEVELEVVARVGVAGRTA
jgi:hypothetical protein